VIDYEHEEPAIIRVASLINDVQKLQKQARASLMRRVATPLSEAGSDYRLMRSRLQECPIQQALAAWQSSGAPLRCSQCGGAVDLDASVAMICIYGLEHRRCHNDEPRIEKLQWISTFIEDEHAAHQDQRIRANLEPFEPVDYGA